MRQLVTFAVLVVVLGLYVARHADQLASSRQTAAMVATENAPSAGPSGYGSDVELAPDRNGHFHTDARLDGRRLDFLVDTGATTIALTAQAAAQLGIHPSASEFTMRVRTANGVVAASPQVVGMVEVGDITVRDVAALVFPDGVLSENLLGMSFLSRLRRYEYTNGRLVLER